MGSWSALEFLSDIGFRSIIVKLDKISPTSCCQFEEGVKATLKFSNPNDVVLLGSIYAFTANPSTGIKGFLALFSECLTVNLDCKLRSKESWGNDQGTARSLDELKQLVFGGETSLVVYTSSVVLSLDVVQNLVDMVLGNIFT